MTGIGAPFAEVYGLSARIGNAPNVLPILETKERFTRPTKICRGQTGYPTLALALRRNGPLARVRTAHAYLLPPSRNRQPSKKGDVI